MLRGIAFCVAAGQPVGSVQITGNSAGRPSFPQASAFRSAAATSYMVLFAVVSFSNAFRRLLCGWPFELVNDGSVSNSNCPTLHTVKSLKAAGIYVWRMEIKWAVIQELAPVRQDVAKYLTQSKNWRHSYDS